MIICLCNRISERAAREVAGAGVRSVTDIYRDLGCRVQCGKCVPEMRRILAEARRDAEAIAQAELAARLAGGERQD
jgi:bacterioferritin-associated ferredoxin